MTWEALQPINPSTQIVTVNQQDVKKLPERLRLGQDDDETDPFANAGWDKEVEDKLHMAIRVVNLRSREEVPKFRINIQVEGINHTPQQWQELWDEEANIEA